MQVLVQNEGDFSQHACDVMLFKRCRWFDIGCILLKDPANHIELQSLTQATPVDSMYVQQAQERTPADYDRRWSGHAVTVGELIEAHMAASGRTVQRCNWHEHACGVSRRDLIYMAAKALANMYKQRLPPESF